MHPLILFDTIMIEPPRRCIYRRLGYRKGVTALRARQEAEVEKDITKALSLIKLRGVGKRISLGEKNNSQVVLTGQDGDEVLRSRKLASFLMECGEVVLMGATAGGEVMAAIEEGITHDHFSRGVVFDATASEMVDASLTWIMSYFARELRRENKILTGNRFSAGYGDFLLENQGKIFRMLQLERIGVQITESFVLVPEKSVTAIAGVEGA
jgi:hypothetical protein